MKTRTDSASTRDAGRGATLNEFEGLLLPVLELAYGVGLRLSRNPDDAADLVQEAALLAQRGFSTFQRGTNFKAWFLRILTNCFFGRCRKRRRQPELVDLDDAPPHVLATETARAGLYGSWADPVEELVGRLDSGAVADAVAALPEDYRAVAVLHFLDDLSYQEIAEIVGCPLGTVRSRLHRGRRVLQNALWQVAVDHGIVAAMSAGTAADLA